MNTSAPSGNPTNLQPKPLVEIVLSSPTISLNDPLLRHQARTSRQQSPDRASRARKLLNRGKVLALPQKFNFVCNRKGEWSSEHSFLALNAGRFTNQIA